MGLCLEGGLHQCCNSFLWVENLRGPWDLHSSKLEVERVLHELPRERILHRRTPKHPQFIETATLI